MFVRIDELVPPANAVVDVPFVRQAARIDEDWDDNLIAFYINSATIAIQNYLNRSLITRTLQFTWAETKPPVSWPYVETVAPVLPFGLEYTAYLNNLAMTLPYGDLQQVSNVAYSTWENEGTTTYLSNGTDYVVDTISSRIRIQDQSLTVPWSYRAHISVIYTAGYGNTMDAVPLPIRHGIIMTVANYYEHRGDIDRGGEISDAVYNNLAAYRSIMFPIR